MTWLDFCITVTIDRNCFKFYNDGRNGKNRGEEGLRRRKAL
jgi:hypothetical protein